MFVPVYGIVVHITSLVGSLEFCDGGQEGGMGSGTGNHKVVLNYYLICS